MSNFDKEFIIVGLHFSLPLLTMVLLIFYFRDKKHFFSVFYLGVFALFINFFIQGTILFFIKRYFYSHYKEVTYHYGEALFDLGKAEFMEHRYVLTLLYVYQEIFKYFVFAFFCIVFKIIVFKFLLKNKKLDDFKKALYFSIGSGFLSNPFCRILSINIWFEKYSKILKSELFLLGINSMFIFVFDFAFSLFILYIFKKTENLKKGKKIFSNCLFFGLLVVINGIIFLLLRMPDTIPYRDVIAVRYYLNFENEIALGIFLVFAISVILSLKNVLLEKNIEKSLE